MDIWILAWSRRGSWPHVGGYSSLHGALLRSYIHAHILKSFFLIGRPARVFHARTLPTTSWPNNGARRFGIHFTEKDAFLCFGKNKQWCRDDEYRRLRWEMTWACNYWRVSGLGHRKRQTERWDCWTSFPVRVRRILGCFRHIHFSSKVLPCMVVLFQPMACLFVIQIILSSMLTLWRQDYGNILSAHAMRWNGWYHTDDAGIDGFRRDSVGCARRRVWPHSIAELEPWIGAACTTVKRQEKRENFWIARRV